MARPMDQMLPHGGVSKQCVLSCVLHFPVCITDCTFTNFLRRCALSTYSEYPWWMEKTSKLETLLEPLVKMVRGNPFGILLSLLCHFHSHILDELVTIYEIVEDNGQYFAVPSYQFEWPVITDPEGTTRNFIQYPGTCGKLILRICWCNDTGTFPSLTFYYFISPPFRSRRHNHLQRCQ
jgi:hypothetical protein